MLKKIAPYFCFILILSAVLPYLVGLGGELVFDDIPLIKEDPFYLQESNPFNCWNRSFWKVEESQGLYRPLTLFSYWLDVRFYSLWADKNTQLFEPGFRITNLIWHVIITILLFQLLLKLSFGKIRSFIASLIYALHPIHVEAVTPAFGRGELLCALFILLGLLLHLNRKKSNIYIFLAGFCYSLAFMSKENGVLFLPIVILVDFYSNKLFERRFSLKSIYKFYKKSSLVIPYSIYSFALFAIFCCRYLAIGSWLPAKQFFQPFIDNNIALSSPVLRVVTAIRIQGMALVKFFWPLNLSCDYSYAEIIPSHSIFDPFTWLTIVLFVAIPSIYIYFFPRDKNKIIFLALVYILSVIPAGNFIIPAGTIFAERLQYLPSIFLSIFFAMLIVRISQLLPRKITIVLSLLIFGGLFFRTYYRTFVWQNSMTLAISGIESAPKSLKVWNNLSAQLCAIKDYRGAIIAVSKAIEIYPEYATGYVNRGSYYFRAGDNKKAKEDILYAISLSENHLYAHFVLAVIYLDEKDFNKADKIIRKILKYYPTNKKLLKVKAVIKEKSTNEASPKSE